MTTDEINRKIDLLAKKRDHCVDVLGKPLLGLTYQMEINELAALLERAKTPRSRDREAYE